jgi:hypothetical protein
MARKLVKFYNTTDNDWKTVCQRPVSISDGGAFRQVVEGSKIFIGGAWQEILCDRALIKFVNYTPLGTKGADDAFQYRVFIDFSYAVSIDYQVRVVGGVLTKDAFFTRTTPPSDNKVQGGEILEQAVNVNVNSNASYTSGYIYGTFQNTAITLKPLAVELWYSIDGGPYNFASGQALGYYIEGDAI